MTEACLGVAVLIEFEIYFCEGVEVGACLHMYNYVIPEIKTQVAICFLPIFLGSVQDMERISLIPRPRGLGMRLGKDILSESCLVTRAISTYVFLLTTIFKHCVCIFSSTRIDLGHFAACDVM